ncbi:MAG: hypothetical protein EON61_05905 [Alphaproteobacteria bacterium]|nr:MAG: hypothetical protein EON61_05905 [Alphaproteobacteria bacterium]
MPKVLSPQDIEAFRERLCDIAEEKFAAQGINGVTLRDLATTMGVSPMTPYPTAFDYPDLVAAMKRARDTMTGGWKILRDQGRFKGDVDLAGHLHWSAMHGAVMLELTGLLKKPHDARAIARRALSALLRDLDVKPKD